MNLARAARDWRERPVSLAMSHEQAGCPGSAIGSHRIRGWILLVATRICMLALPRLIPPLVRRPRPFFLARETAAAFLTLLGIHTAARPILAGKWDALVFFRRNR